MPSSRTFLLVACLGAGAAFAAPATPSLEPPDAPVHACAAGGPVRLELAGPDRARRHSRVSFEVTPELELAWIETEVELPLGGRVRDEQRVAASSPRAGETLRGSVSLEMPEAVAEGSATGAVLVRARYGLRQPDGSVEVMAAEEILVLGGGPLPVAGVPVVSGGRATLDVPARHRPRTAAEAQR